MMFTRSLLRITPRVGETLQKASLFQASPLMLTKSNVLCSSIARFSNASDVRIVDSKNNCCGIYSQSLWFDIDAWNNDFMRTQRW